MGRQEVRDRLPVRLVPLHSLASSLDQVHAITLYAEPAFEVSQFSWRRHQSPLG